jgi:hypothetical protein
MYLARVGEVGSEVVVGVVGARASEAEKPRRAQKTKATTMVNRNMGVVVIACATRGFSRDPPPTSTPPQPPPLFPPFNPAHLTCAVCFEGFKDPHFAPCGKHAFCHGCLAAIAAASTADADLYGSSSTCDISCPLCRHKAPFSEITPEVGIAVELALASHPIAPAQLPAPTSASPPRRGGLSPGPPPRSPPTSPPR